MGDWFERQQAFVRACARIGDVSPEQSLADLDALDLDGASVFDIALWLNNRAYVLVQTGVFDQALESLAEAEDLLEGDKDRSWLISCIIGTRGIAQLHAGDLDEAERNLEHALAMDDSNVDHDDNYTRFYARRLTSERLWWLAAIAEKRGHQRTRLDRLEAAAQFGDTPFGERARAALASKQ